MKNTLPIRSLLLLAVLTACMTVRTSAQSMANYGPPSRSTGIIYNSIESYGSAIYSWRNFDVSTEDDNRSYPVPIGFDFYYCGQRFTTFSASTNGFIDFSNSTRDGGPGTGTRANWAFGPYDQDLSTRTRSSASGDGGTVLAIAPFYYDLTTQGELDPLGGSIKYLVTGTAPNRVLTVEWIRMAIWTNTTPNFNFQVKLYESSGKIEFVYSTMVLGTFNFAASPTNGYTAGMSGPVLNATPTAAQALIQQTANTTSFSNGQQNNLTTVPASNSMLTFTPPVPAAPANLAFTGVSTTGMTLNWSDYATNEVGYVIYCSQDGGATYNFVRQLGAGATSSVEGDLLPGITYQWRVYAVSEGALSSPLSGSRATNPPSQFISRQTGDWNSGSTWVGNIVPTAYADVIIDNGHTVTISTDVQVSDLTVGQGGAASTLLIGTNNRVRTVTIAGNLDVRANGTFKPNTNNVTHLMTLGGNLTNAGTFEMAPAGAQLCNVTFTREGSQSISGAGTATHFNRMTLDMGASKANILDVSASHFAAAPNFLTLTNGTFNLASPATITPFTSVNTIPITAGLTLNNSSAVVNTSGGDLNVNGDLTVHAGTLNVGSAANQDLVSYGGRVIFDGGAVNIAGGFFPKDNYTISDFTMSNTAVVTVNTVGCTSIVYAPFTMSVSGSRFAQSGGTLVIHQKGGGAGNDNLAYTNYFYSVYSVTGGTLQLGNATTPSAQTMIVKSSIPVYHLTLYNSSVTAVLTTYPLTVNGNVAINGGVLNSNALDMTVAGSWMNSGTFQPSTARVTFNGGGALSVQRTAGETFNNLTVAMAPGATLSLGSAASVGASFALASGTLAVGANTLTLNGPVTGGGILTSAAAGSVNYNQAADNQTVLLANYGNLNFSSSIKTLPNSGIVGVQGSFTSARASGHTIAGSTVAFNGSGAQAVAPFTFNNLQLITGGTKTFASGADSVLGNLTIASGVTVTGGASIYASKNIAHDGTTTGAGTITLSGGTAPHALTGAGTYGNLVLNDAQGATFANDLTVTGQLTLTAGVLTPVADQKVVVTTGASVARTGGWINGALERAIATGASTTQFDIGDATRYAPGTIAFSNVTAGGGTLTAKTVQGDHPQIFGSSIDPTNSVNRYWTLTTNALAFDSCRVSVSWINPADEDVAGSESRYIVGRYNGTAWDTVHVDQHGTNTIRAVHVTSFGDFAVGFNGNANAYRTKGGGAGSGMWNASTIWQYLNAQTNTWRDTTAYPVASNAGLISIQTGDAVTVPFSLDIDQTLVQSGAQLIIPAGQTLSVMNGTGTDLTVNGLLRNAGSSIDVQPGAGIAFGSGSSYQHAIAGGSIPAATWDSTSTCEVQGATTSAPANLDQAFGNFIWNCAGQTAAINLMNVPHAIGGRYTVASTGSATLQLFGGGANQVLAVKRSFAVLGGTTIGIAAGGADNGTITVGDSLVMKGGIFTLSTTNGDRLDMTIAGHAAITGGTLRMSASSSTDVLTVAKDFAQTSGTIDETGSGRGRIVFNGTASQRYTSGGTVAGSIDYVVNTGARVVMGTNIMTGAGTFSLQNGGTVSLGSTQGITSSGAAGNVQVAGSRTYGTAANYIYNGTVAQATGNGLPATVSTLTINNAAGVALTASAAITDTLSLVSGVFNIGAATLTLNNIAQLTSGSLQSGTAGTVVYNRLADGQPIIQAAYGNLTCSNFKKLFPPTEITIAGTFLPGTATGHTITGNTITYNGGAQTIAAFEYNNLKTGGTGTKVLSSFGASCVVDKDLSLLGGTFADSGYTITVKGGIVNNTAHTGGGWVKLSGGSAAHVLSGTGSYMNVMLNDGMGAQLQTNNLTVNGVLSLTTGVVATGTNTVIIGTTGSIERATNSSNLRHVFGAIIKPVPVNAGTQSITFETGDAAHYTPVDLIFTNVTTAGTLTATATTGAHPSIGASGIDPAKCANRYWTLANTGTVFASASVNLNFDATDVVPSGGATSAYFMKRFNASAWTLPTLYSRGSFNIRADGLTAFGDFITGELTDKFHWSGLAGNYLWNDANNWNLINVPTPANDVILDGTASDSINVNIAAVCRNLDITNSALVLTILPAQNLTVGGNLTMSAGRLNTQNLLPAVTGTRTITGGTIGFTSPGAQSVVVWPYNHLLVAGGGTKTAAAALTVNDLTIGAGTVFADAGFTMTVKGNAVNNGTHAGTGKISLASGSAQHVLSGGGMYKNLELNDAAGALVQTAPAVNGVLWLTTGIMMSTADTIDVVNPGTVVRTAGYIVGYLNKYVNTSGTVSLTYELGSVSAYLPVALTLTGASGSGSITVGSIAGDHPDLVNAPLSATADAHRYWSIADNGVAITNYTASFQWAPGELQSGIVSASDLILAQKPLGTGAAWTEAASSSPTLTSIQGTGLVTFGAFQAGKPDTSTFVAVANGDWNVPGTWNKYRVPQPRNGAFIGSPFTVRLTDPRSIRLLAVDNGGTFNTNGQTLTLSTTMLLNGIWSGAGTVLWNTSTTDNFYGNGGTTTGGAVLQITGSNKTFAVTNTSLGQIDLSATSTVTNAGSLGVARITGAAAGSTFINAANASLSVSEDLLTTGTLTVSGANNTVTYNGTAVSQTVKPADYQHLSITGARTGSATVTFPSGSTIGVAGSFLPTATFATGGYVTTGSTVKYNATGSQTIAAWGAYHHLTITNARGAGSITLAPGTIGIAGLFTPLAGATYNTMNSTIDFDGTAAQTVPSFAYYHVRFSHGGGAAKTAAGALSAAGDLTIASGATFDASTAAITLNGNWTNNGTFIPSTSTVVLAGASPAVLTGTTTFSTLQVNKLAMGTTVTLANPMQTAVLAMTQGLVQTGVNAMTITADRSGSGLVIGTIVRTQLFTAGTAYAFEGPNNLITFNTGGTLPTSVTETVVLASPGATTSMDPINRYYTLAATGGTGFTFTYRLHYEDAEIVAPNTEAGLKLWHELSPSGSNTWERKGMTAADAAVANYVELSGVAATDMGRWSLSSRTVPNLVLTLAQDKANPAPGEQVTYTITWQNTGDGAATNSLFTALVPASTTFVNGSVAYNSIASTEYSIALGVITFNLTAVNGGVIPPGGTGTITYKVTIN